MRVSWGRMYSAPTVYNLLADFGLSLNHDVIVYLDVFLTQTCIADISMTRTGCTTYIHNHKTIHDQSIFDVFVNVLY